MAGLLSVGQPARRAGLTAKALRGVDLPIDDVRRCLDGDDLDDVLWRIGDAGRHA